MAGFAHLSFIFQLILSLVAIHGALARPEPPILQYGVPAENGLEAFDTASTTPVAELPGTRNLEAKSQLPDLPPAPEISQSNAAQEEVLEVAVAPENSELPQQEYIEGYFTKPIDYNRTEDYQKPESQGYDYQKPESQGYDYQKPENQGYDYPKPESQGYDYPKPESQGYDYPKPDNQDGESQQPESVGYEYQTPTAKTPYYHYPPIPAPGAGSSFLPEAGSNIQETVIEPDSQSPSLPGSSESGEQILSTGDSTPSPPTSGSQSPVVIPPGSMIKIEDGRGQYSHGFSAPDGTQVQESGHLITTNGGWEYVIAKEGSYSYTSPEGIPIRVGYVADDNGFRITSRSFGR
ncbi:pollen-specific leucine-rich repeat extensin-like protein 1 [Diprion similis]|uniref:pollen-specific leucine-rich repeat extensin-like protein 1 n=1 Tax=Diprion similis TaxID=362088 RepID=UPI001EF8E25D|nr:pollen-specific leucine-rich repeat extensin-like protein 1 [Diprion similis]